MFKDHLGQKIKQLIFILIAIFFVGKGFCSNDELPFKIGERLFYEVYFNGIRTGKVEVEYQGQKEFNGVPVDIISLSSDVNILILLQIESEELIYADKNTHLPLYVERKIKFFGREELILEEYNQKEGWVKIRQAKDESTQRLIHIPPPIHNAIILYFLYPLELKDETIDKTYEFNLPTCKISIKVKEARRVTTHKGIEEFYILEGSPRRFEVWLKKGKRLPLRVEIPAFLGRIVITRV